MSHREGASPTGKRWWSRWGIPLTAVLAVLVVTGVVGIVVWAPWSPDSSLQATEDQPPATRSSRTPSATVSATSLEPSTTPSATATSQAPPPGGSQPQQPPPAATKPVIAGFAATADGLMVTVSFTVDAQADHAPFTCSVRRASIGTDEFPCNVGPVSRTYDYDFCCGSEIYVIATDGLGVSSDQWNGSVDFARPDPPSYSNLVGWHDGKVHVQFSVSSAPGDDPMCDIGISRILGGGSYSNDALPCEGTVDVSFDGPPDSNYDVRISVTSDSYWNPPPPDLVQVKV